MAHASSSALRTTIWELGGTEQNGINRKQFGYNSIEDFDQRTLTDHTADLMDEKKKQKKWVLIPVQGVL